MRKLLVAAVLLLLTPAVGSASFSIFGAYWDTSEAGDTWGGGLRLGLGLLPFLEIEIAGTYMDKFAESVTVADLGVLAGELEAIPIDVGARFDIGLPFGIYFGAGGSFFLLDSNLGNIDDELGLYGAVGIVLFKRLFVEVMYRLVEGTFDRVDLSSLIPELIVREEVDVDLSGFVLNVGLRF